VSRAAIAISLLCLAAYAFPQRVVTVQVRPVIDCRIVNAGNPTRLKGSGKPVCLGRDVWANENDVESARVEKDLEGKPMVMLTLRNQAAARLRDLTSKHIGDRIGILVGRDLVVTPQIHAPAAEVPIQGVYSPAQAQDLADALNRQARKR
jgi:preprotein translocase subunit SecD